MLRIDIVRPVVAEAEARIANGNLARPTLPEIPA